MGLVNEIKDKYLKNNKYFMWKYGKENSYYKTKRKI